MKLNTVLITVVLFTAAAFHLSTMIALSKSKDRQEETLAAIEATQPKTVELSNEQLDKFYDFEALVRLTIKKAAEHDKEFGLSFEDWKGLLETTQFYKGSRIIPIEGHPPVLYARKPKGNETAPGIYLLLPNGEERWVHYGNLLTYTGHNKLGDWAQFTGW